MAGRVSGKTLKRPASPIECIEYGDVSMEVPVILFNSRVCMDSVLSMNTWNNFLTEDERKELKAMLPFGDSEKEVLIDNMFSGSAADFHFQSPGEEVARLFHAGALHPETRPAYTGLVNMHKNLHELDVLQRRGCMVTNIIMKRQKMLDAARGIYTLEEHRDRMSISHKRKLVALELRETRNRHATETMASEVPPSSTAFSASLDDKLMKEDDLLLEMMLQERGEQSEANLALEVFAHKMNRDDAGQLKKPMFDHTKADIDVESLCERMPNFFFVLERIFEKQPNQRANSKVVEKCVRTWQEQHPLARCLPWVAENDDWGEQVRAALRYLSSAENLTPVLNYQKLKRVWIWDPRDIPNLREHLVHAYNLWPRAKGIIRDSSLSTKKKLVSSVSKKAFIEPTPSTVPPVKHATKFELKDMTAEMVLVMQKQEHERYDQPEKVFIFTAYGFKSIVAPVKGVLYSKDDFSHQRPRDHPLLISERPPYVTILSLALDAVARLPNGEGTRVDVCKILCDSIYLKEGTTDHQVNEVVSGALDRLNCKTDPPVKFIKERKSWCYMYRHRSVEEFEAIHAEKVRRETQRKKEIIENAKSKRRLRSLAPKNAQATSHAVDNDARRVVSARIATKAVATTVATADGDGAADYYDGLDDEFGDYYGDSDHGGDEAKDGAATKAAGGVGQ